jgi:nucleoside-diphosphate-sugar epimerase
MRVLVTGGTGFIGRYVIRALEAGGHALTIAVRTPESAETEWRRRHRVVPVGEICGTTDWRSALQDVDAVVHLAAKAHIANPSDDDREAFHRTNVLGTDRLAERAAASGIRRFVLMSSIGAVTNSSEERVTLDTPCRPSTPYGRSKLASERALTKRASGTSMTWTILRPTLVYGRDNPGNMKRLIALVRSGLPLPIGAIRNRRSFTYVENLADLVVHALGHPAAENQVFLVADGDDLSTPELIRKMGTMSGRRVRILVLPLPVLSGVASGLDAASRALPIRLPTARAAVERLAASLYVDGDDVRDRLDWCPPLNVDEGLRCMLGTP